MYATYNAHISTAILFHYLLAAAHSASLILHRTQKAWTSLAWVIVEYSEAVIINWKHCFTTPNMYLTTLHADEW